MRFLVRAFLLFAAGAAFAGGLASSQSGGMTAAEKEVWQQEESYWRYAEAFDLEAYRALWHDAYIGWPTSEGQPVEKENVTTWLERARDKRQTLRYELRPQAVRIFDGRVAIVHYAVNRVFRDPAGEPEGGWYKITHTWMKVGGKWKIIAGMSATLPASQQPASQQ